MLQRQGRDCRVLRVGLGCRPDLCPVDEHLGDPAVFEPAAAACVGLAGTFKPERLAAPAAGQASEPHSLVYFGAAMMPFSR